MRNKKQGFTLIELLVVIAIIGLLASVVLVSLNSARSKSRNAKRVADMNQIAKALELYFNTCNSYPVVTASTTLTSSLYVYEGSAANCGNNQGSSTNGGIGTTVSGKMISRFTTAPIPADSSLCATGNNNSYIYRSYDDVNLTTPSNSSDTSAGGYAITFCLGDNTGGLTAGNRILTPSGFR